MGLLSQAFSAWLQKRADRRHLQRVEAELRIRQQLDWVEQRQQDEQSTKTIVLSQPELTANSIYDPQRRC